MFADFTHLRTQPYHILSIVTHTYFSTPTIHSLFATFLDTKHMMYSSAIFDTRLVPTSSVTVGGKSTVSLEFHGSLEDAQTRKIDALLARLEPLDAQHTLLDIGFGWGGVCIRAAEKYGCKVHGITLSVEQKELAEQLVQEKGLFLCLFLKGILLTYLLTYLLTH